MNRQIFWKLRYPLVASLAVAAIGICALVFWPFEPSVSVLVAAHDLQAGQVLQAEDFTERKVYDTGLSAEPLTKKDIVSGSFVAVDISGGTILQKGFLLGQTWSQLRPGEVGLALELGDQAGQQVAQAGQILEIWASSGGQSVVVAPQVRVLGVRRGEDSFLSTTAADCVVLLSTVEESARAILAARPESDLSFVVRG